jgi:hypothetical protein
MTVHSDTTAHDRPYVPEGGKPQERLMVAIRWGYNGERPTDHEDHARRRAAYLTKNR